MAAILIFYLPSPLLVGGRLLKESYDVPAGDGYVAFATRFFIQSKYKLFATPAILIGSELKNNSFFMFF
jgi:hypothetical protein